MKVLCFTNHTGLGTVCRPTILVLNLRDSTMNSRNGSEQDETTKDRVKQYTLLLAAVQIGVFPRKTAADNFFYTFNFIF